MKKLLVFIVTVAISCVALAGCTSSEQTPQNAQNDVANSEAVNQAETQAQTDLRDPEANFISEETAVQSALENAHLTQDEVSGLTCELVIDNDVPTYEVKFFNDSSNYTLEVNATDGMVIGFDKSPF